MVNKALRAGVVRKRGSYRAKNSCLFVVERSDKDAVPYNATDHIPTCHCLTGSGCTAQRAKDHSQDFVVNGTLELGKRELLCLGPIVRISGVYNL